MSLVDPIGPNKEGDPFLNQKTTSNNKSTESTMTTPSNSQQRADHEHHCQQALCSASQPLTTWAEHKQNEVLLISQ